METFKAEENSIYKLFIGNSKKTIFRIPSYQRPYSWGKDQIEQFCEDIKDSFENKTPFLIGSIILVEDKNNKNSYDVVDGQQRLTTISIFLSVLKNFVKEETKKELEEIFLLGEETKVIRVATATKTYADFKEVLTNWNYEKITEKLKIDKKNNFYLNSKYIYDLLETYKKNEIDFDELFEFFKEDIQIIKVHTLNKEIAFKLFEVLNSRGLPLKNSDLIKNHLIGELNKHYKENSIQEENDFISSWEDKEKYLKELDEELEDLLTYFIYYKLGKNPKKSLFIEFVKIYEHYENYELFKEDFDTFYKLHTSLFSFEENEFNEYKKIQLMKYLPNGRFWKSIILTYLMSKPKKDNDFKELINFLFKFYFLNLFGRQTVNPYKQLSFDIINSIKIKKFKLVERKELYNLFNDKDFEINKLKEISEVYFEKEIGEIIPKLKKELNEDVYNEKFCKILLYILEAYETNEETENSDLFKNQTNIEHIYPQNPKKNEEIEELNNVKNNLGNLTILIGKTNKTFSNKKFSDKKKDMQEKYQNKNKFNLSEEVFKKDTWDLNKVEERQKELLGKIEKIFELEENCLIN
jgi:uncharacterized protein with ParB-like and HNH nuclease domain